MTIRQTILANRALRWVLELVIGIALCAALVLLYFPGPAHALDAPLEARHYQREYTRIVRSEWGLDAPVAALAAQIEQESAWDCHAVSRAGARGCAQFMPTTANWIGDLDSGLRGGDVLSPAWAFRAQAVYMKWLNGHLQARDACERMAFAQCGFNGGLGWVYRRQKLSRRPGVCFDATCEVNPGISAASQRENADYPRRIRRLEAKYDRWGPRACS